MAGPRFTDAQRGEAWNAPSGSPYQPGPRRPWNEPDGPTPSEPTPADRLEEILDLHAHSVHDPSALPEPADADDPSNRYALVEENVRGGTWISLHETPEAARYYNTHQEYAGDWTVDSITDLATGLDFTEPAPFQVGEHVTILGGFERGLAGFIVANEPRTLAQLTAELPGTLAGRSHDRPYRYRVAYDLDDPAKTVGGLHPADIVRTIDLPRLHLFEPRTSCPTTNGADLEAWERKTLAQRAATGCARCGESVGAHEL